MFCLASVTMVVSLKLVTRLLTSSFKSFKLSSSLNQKCRDKLIEHKLYIAEYGKDLPEIIDWHFNN